MSGWERWLLRAAAGMTCLAVLCVASLALGVAYAARQHRQTVMIRQEERAREEAAEEARLAALAEELATRYDHLPLLELAPAEDVNPTLFYFAPATEWPAPEDMRFVIETNMDAYYGDGELKTVVNGNGEVVVQVYADEATVLTDLFTGEVQGLAFANYFELYGENADGYTVWQTAIQGTLYTPDGELLQPWTDGVLYEAAMGDWVLRKAAVNVYAEGAEEGCLYNLATGEERYPGAVGFGAPDVEKVVLTRVKDTYVLLDRQGEDISPGPMPENKHSVSYGLDSYGDFYALNRFDVYGADFSLLPFGSFSRWAEVGGEYLVTTSSLNKDDNVSTLYTKTGEEIAVFGSVTGLCEWGLLARETGYSQTLVYDMESGEYVQRIAATLTPLENVYYDGTECFIMETDSGYAILDGRLRVLRQFDVPLDTELYKNRSYTLYGNGMLLLRAVPKNDDDDRLVVVASLATGETQQYEGYRFHRIYPASAEAGGYLVYCSTSYTSQIYNGYGHEVANVYAKQGEYGRLVVSAAARNIVGLMDETGVWLYQQYTYTTNLEDE